MKYEFRKINKFKLSRWMVYLGFSRSVQIKVLENPVEEEDGWIYPVELISYTTKWLWLTLKITNI